MFFRAKLFYYRLTWVTKMLLLLVALDLCAPGWLVFGIPSIGTVDLSRVAQEIRGE